MTNPFVSLFLVPVTLLAVAAYTALLLRYLARIHDPEAMVGFERHVIGMWINFLLAAALLCGFLLVLAAVLRARERELGGQRERLMRDDAVVSVAAGAAHALNKIAPHSPTQFSNESWVKAQQSIIGQLLTVRHGGCVKKSSLINRHKPPSPQGVGGCASAKVRRHAEKPGDTLHAVAQPATAGE